MARLPRRVERLVVGKERGRRQVDAVGQQEHPAGPQLRGHPGEQRLFARRVKVMHRLHGDGGVERRFAGQRAAVLQAAPIERVAARIGG